MPALSAHDANVIRQFPQRVTRHLSVCPRDPLFKALVSSWTTDDDTGGITDITYTSVTLGVFANVTAGLMVDIGTTEGARDIGTMRIRKDADASKLYVAETALGEVLLVANYHITVRNSRAPINKLPFMSTSKSTNQNYYDTFTYKVDYEEAYTDENENYAPLANIEANPSGYPDSGQTYRTVTLTGSNSAAVGKSDTISTYLWVIGDGTLVAGYSLTDADIKVQFPEGTLYREISLTVTSSNGASSTRYFPIFVHGDHNPPFTNFSVDRDDTDVGREMEFTLFDDDDRLTESVIPEGSLVIYWETAQFAQEDPPSAYRGQVMGWVMRDAVLVKIQNRSTYFISMSGPAAWLDLIDSASMSWLRRTTPTEWYHMADCTDDRAIVHLLRHRTNILDLCNVYQSGVTDEWGQPDSSDYAALKVDRGSIWQQINMLAAEYAGHVLCDSLGNIRMTQHPSLLSENYGADRDDVATTLALTAADWTDERGLELPNEHIKPVGGVLLNGFSWSGSASAAHRARAPGQTPSYGASQEEPPAQVLPASNAAAKLRDVAGHWWAYHNNPRPDITLQLAGNMDIFEPSLREWITLSIPSNVRGLSIPDRWLVKRVSVTHSNNLGEPPKTVHLTLEQETSGNPGQTVAIPASSTLDDWVDPGSIFPGDAWGQPPTDQGPSLASTAVYGITQSVVRRTRNFLASSPDWETIYTPPANWTIRDGKLYQFDPKNTAIMVIESVLTSEVKVVQTTNLNNTTPTWSDLYTFAYDSKSAFLRSVNQFENTWFLMLNTISNGVRSIKTSDNWTTIEDNVQVSTTVNSKSIAYEVTLHAASQSFGVVWCADRLPSNYPAMAKSGDYGTSFPITKQVDTTTYNDPHFARMPWLGNDDELQLWIGGGDSAAHDGWLFYTINGGASWQDRTPQYDGYGWAGGISESDFLRPLGAFDETEDKIAIIAYRSSLRRGLTEPRFFTSLNRGVSWSHKGQLDSYMRNIGGWPYDSDVVFATGQTKIQYSPDFGDTWADKHWSGYADGIDTIPVWVE